MKRAWACGLLTLILFGCLVNCSQAAEKNTVRVLITTGGHDFEAEPFYTIFDAMPDVAYTKAQLPQNAGLLKPELAESCDVIVMYDMTPGISLEQQKAFVELLQKGIGLVALHHNIGAHRDWDEYRKIIGGKYIFEPTTLDGTQYPPSGYKHDEDLSIQVVNPKDPITKGLEDFRIHDETYGPFYTAPSVHVLLRTDHSNNNPIVAWTHSYGNSRVLYLMLGHDAKAYENPQYRELVHRGIRWAAGR